MTGMDRVRWAYNIFLDHRDRLTGRHHPLVPPRNLNFIGDGDYLSVGRHFFQHFVELGGLTPEHRVLDVGSGMGRMAVPLTHYLSSGTEYWGIDIVERGIEWSRRHISARHPNFRFQHADLYNKLYNPSGEHLARAYRFPFPDRHFDFALATSLFTHMLPEDASNYLAEIHRVLRPGGTFFGTFFVLTPDSTALMASGVSSQNFVHRGAGYCTVNAEVPEDAVAYEEETLRRMHGESGLAIVSPIHYGWWSGSRGRRSYQDIVVSRRPCGG